MFKKSEKIMKSTVSFTLGFLMLLSGCTLDIDMNTVPNETSTNKSEAPPSIVIHPMDENGKPIEHKPTVSDDENTQDPEVTDPDNNGGETTDPNIDGQGAETPDPPPEITVTYGRVEETERCDDSYFSDAVFIGDSISLMLSYYARDQRKENPAFLGGGQFLTSGSFSYRNATLPVTESSIHPSYQGEKMLIEDAIALIGAKKIYIMLGMNDIAGKNYSATLENMTEIISRILEKSSDVEFYLESVTPRMEDAQKERLNNDIIRGWNTRLEKYCEENGYFFLNVYEAVSDSNGNLKAEYCSDPVSAGDSCMGIHMTYAGCEKWVEYLYTHAPALPEKKG